MNDNSLVQEFTHHPLRVLLLEDSPFDAELLKEELLISYPRASLQLVSDGHGFTQALNQGGFDVILSDYHLGGYSGSEALKLAQQQTPLIPFIFVSGVIGEDNVAELLKRGATDYVSKGRLERLPLVLERALREVQERAARLAAETDLRTARDEAERLTVQLVLRAREVEAGEARLRAATEAGDIGIWELDLVNQQFHASNHFKKNFGRSEASPFSYAELQDAVHPDDIARMQAAIAHTLATGDDYRIEYRIQRPNGQLAWVRIIGRLEYHADGQPLRMSGISQDTTDVMLTRRRGEVHEHLDRHVYRGKLSLADIAYGAAEALGQVLDASRAGFGTVDQQEETVTIERDWNATGIQSLAGFRQFREYDGFIEDLKRGETVLSANALTDPRTKNNADAYIASKTQSFIYIPIIEGNGLVALFYLHHASARYWTAEEISLVREVAHRTWHAMERRRAEQKIHALANSLERKVRERTAELMKSEEALRQSQKMEAVGQLTGGLAHDFNNLLGAISGSLEILKRRMGHEEVVVRYVEIGQTATKRAAALTHRLLAFSRRQTLEPKVVEVNQLIGGFEDLVRRTIGPQVVLEVVAGISTWPVHADPGQLENALLNLCINARDAMPHGGRLVIETSNLCINADTKNDEQMLLGQYVTISVTDNGSGMPPSVITRAFDPFFTTKPLGLGTGLGLSMVYGFAKQSGGQARIYSELGLGTSVHMYLPRYLGNEVSAEDAAAPKPVLDTDGSGETILVVDDEDSIRILMSETLQALGYRVLEAGDGSHAMRILQADPSIMLLVTDVGLPGGMNGRQVADAARSLFPQLQVLFVTGYAENAVLSHGHLPTGMQILTKPFELQTFGHKVQMLMKSNLLQLEAHRGP
jgi:PAS domain S-box-containing protein